MDGFHDLMSLLFGWWAAVPPATLPYTIAAAQVFITGPARE
jgi:hypothetical protein